MDVPELAGPPAAVLERALPGAATGARCEPARSVAHSTAIVPLFATTMFLSGFLLFLVEPMAAKMVLPILGGVPMVWNGCVVFFQIVMLAGYGYAFGASRWLRVRHHVLVHAAVLAAPAAVLPFVIQAGSARPPDGNPLGWLLLLLAGTIGVPFFVLSTSASVFQHWLSRTDHPSAQDPYFLYSASNLGCLLALASYPTIVEPIFTLREQSRLWATGYAEFVLLAIACAAIAWRRSERAAPDTTIDSAREPAAAPLEWTRRGRWVALAFVPSSLMLAVTSHISTDIGAVPLLWIVPLALYLVTFVLAFGRRSAAVGAFARRALPLAVVPLALFMMAGVQGPLVTIVSLHLAAFAVLALNCHAELAKDRPEASHLTEFYFWLSFGGMLGGLFNALAAPLLFNSILEYPLVVVLGCLLFRPTDVTAELPRRLRDLAIPLVVGVLTAGIFAVLVATRAPLGVQLAALAVPALIAFTERRSTRFGWCIAAMILARLASGNAGERVLYATRTFFGIYRVSEDLGGRYHELVHGTTQHGLQALAPERRGEALTYYHESGPFGQAWEALPSAANAHEIAVVGLGVGTLASYARADQRWTFFEIDPAVERIARTREYFSFMDACGDRCRVVIGDARVSLTRVPERTYDLLVLDAFSSDAIPMHLLTREAFGVYLSRLTPDGVLVLHISNRHLRLAPIVGRLAESHGLVALQEIDAIQPGSPEGKQASQWVVMGRKPADVDALTRDTRWSALAPPPATPLWTDDFSNILSVLSVR
ncbi:MAG TPA: fused MFS/spermidine synthase [Vicinamibacterales bacterium]